MAYSDHPQSGPGLGTQGLGTHGQNHGLEEEITTSAVSATSSLDSVSNHRHRGSIDDNSLLGGSHGNSVHSVLSGSATATTAAIVRGRSMDEDEDDDEREG